MSSCHIESIFIYLLVILHCVYVFSGSFSGRQLTEHIKYYEEINYNIDDIANQHLRVARSPGLHRQSSVDIKFYSHDRYFHLRLRRDASIFMQDFALVTSEGEIPYSVNSVYVGEIVDEPGSHCHGTITNGTLSGRVYTKEDTYSLEPAKLYFDNSEFHSVMYADKHVDKDGLMGSGCGVVGEIQKRMQERLDKAQKEQDENAEKDEAPSQGKSRHRRQTMDQQTCPLFIQTDHVFYQKFGSREAVVSYIANHVQAADFIYSTTNFDRFRNINFAISRLRVWTTDDRDNNPDYKFKQQFIGVEKFLDLSSEGDWSQYCAAYTFTDRDFSNGVLGLAWIASTGTNSDGGICSSYSRAQSGSTLNTGIVTLNNYGSFVPPTVSHLTFAHELGHSFGSAHDPFTADCTPGGDQGNYLMFSHASSGNNPNNNDFSTCSIGYMTNVLNSIYSLTSKQTWCFVEKSAVRTCGNDIVEEGEECDCGYTGTCDDKCCNAQTEDHSNTNACTLKMGQCSPSEGACCDADTCMHKSSSDVCKAQGECNGAGMCPGDSAICPMPAPRRDGETCDNDRLLCNLGSCNQSICTLGANLEQCQCAGERAALCQVCCQNPNQPQTCVPSYRINIPNGVNIPTNMSVGSPCNNYMGYCDIFNECRLANEDGPLTSIIRRIFFSDEPEIIEAIKTWLEEMWWVVLICVLCVLAVMIVTVLICNRLVPTTNPFRKEKERQKKERRASVRYQGRQDRSSTKGRSTSYESAF